MPGSSAAQRRHVSGATVLRRPHEGKIPGFSPPDKGHPSGIRGDKCPAGQARRLASESDGTQHSLPGAVRNLAYQVGVIPVIGAYDTLW